MNAQFASFVDPARQYNDLWRVLVTILAFLVLYAVFTFFFFMGLSFVLGAEDQANIIDGSFDTPVSMLVLLASFAFWVLALLIPLRLFHKRGLSSLLGAGPKRLAIAFGIGVLVYGILLFVIGILQNDAPELASNIEPSVWVYYLIPGLILLLIQVSAEELLFRGYLQQQIAARFNSVPLALILPSILFGLGHFSMKNGIEQALMLVCITALLGLILAEVTRRTGNLGAAIGIHFLNNLSGMFFVSYQDFAGGLALYKAVDYIESPELLAQALQFQLIIFAVLTAGYFAFRWVRSRNS